MAQNPVIYPSDIFSACREKYDWKASRIVQFFTVHRPLSAIFYRIIHKGGKVNHIQPVDDSKRGIAQPVQKGVLKGSSGGCRDISVAGAVYHNIGKNGVTPLLAFKAYSPHGLPFTYRPAGNGVQIYLNIGLLYHTLEDYFKYLRISVTSVTHGPIPRHVEVMLPFPHKFRLFAAGYLAGGTKITIRDGLQPFDRLKHDSLYHHLFFVTE